MEQETVFEHPEQFSLCQRVRERLPDLIEGYLDALTAEALRAHLSVCYLCSREYREMQRTIQLIETLPFAEHHRDVSEAVMAAIDPHSGHSFQAPVVEMETTLSLSVSSPRTITGHQRHIQPLRRSAISAPWAVLQSPRLPTALARAA